MQGRLEKEIKLQRAIDDVLNDMPKFVKEWYLNLKNSGKPMTSCYDSVRKIRNFIEYISDNPRNMDVSEITLSACESYCISIQTKVDKNGIETYTSDSYIRGIRSALNSFLKYLSRNKYIEYNYMEDVARIKSKANKQCDDLILNQSDFNKILSAAKKRSDYMDGFFKNRDVLIVLLFMTTGIKKTAMSEIGIEDINLKEKTLTIQSKNGIPRTYCLTKQTINYINLWLEDREKIKTEDSGSALLLSASGKRLGHDTIYNIVKQSCEIGIGKSLPPHKLRSGFCSILYNQTHDIRLVNEIAGHSTIHLTKECIKLNQKSAAKIMSDVIKIK